MTTQLLNFQRQFVDAVLSGKKRRTIRLIRKRNPAAGDELRLYTGLRQPGARLLRVEICQHVSPVNILGINTINIGGFNVIGSRLAREDGFERVRDFIAFFVKQYGPLPIIGRLCCIYWTPTADGLARAEEIMAGRLVNCWRGKWA